MFGHVPSVLARRDRFSRQGIDRGWRYERGPYCAFLSKPMTDLGWEKNETVRVDLYGSVRGEKNHGKDDVNGQEGAHHLLFQGTGLLTRSTRAYTLRLEE